MLRVLLWPASILFQGIALVRARLYDSGRLRRRWLGGRVLSVGNLTVGGTGKTPMVLWLADRLCAEGKRVAILTRGYPSGGRTEERGTVMSDEVALLRNRLSGKVQFGVGRNRYEKGRVLERHGVEWFILDDGFQHFRLARDVDIVLIDATDPFGGGRLLPAGRLREPRSALARADVIVITRSAHAPAVEAVVRRYAATPIFYAQTALNALRAFSETGQPSRPAAPDCHALNFFAFCGIGNPQAFFEDLRRWGIAVVGKAAYPDHHRYSERDAESLEALAVSAGAGALLCTEKDTHNLRQTSFRMLPLFYCEIALHISNEEEFWRAVVEKAERSRARAGS